VAVIGRKMAWIDPSGRQLEFGTNHIGAIIQHPSKFGTNKSEVESIFKKYNEVIPSEGKARDEIIRDVVKKGFVRVRQQKNYTSMTIDKLVGGTKKLLQKWASNEIKTDKRTDPYMPVKIYQVSNDKMKEYTIKDLSTGVHMYEQDELYNVDLVVVNDVSDFGIDRTMTFQEYIMETHNR
jgi:hypothetical protein